MLLARSHDGTNTNFFTLKDIAKLSTYCEATPYSHMWHMIVPTRRHADMYAY